MATRVARLARITALLALALTGAGCARVFGHHDVAPSGLAVQEDRLRQMLARGLADTAFVRFGRGTPLPEDDVLGALYQGVVAYHAGRFSESADILDRVADLADDRVTKSISRSAFSLISNDLVLPYEPAPTERLMIPYYGALARIRLGDIDGAAVEARRLSQLLQRFDHEQRGDITLRATLRYFSATIFAAAGEWNDADVAYRNAVALGSTLPPPAPASADSGAVLIVLEQGFVAHRVEQGLMVMLMPEEIDHITGGDNEDRFGAAALVAARVLDHAAHAGRFAVGMRTGGGTLYVPAPDATPRKRKRMRTRCTERTIAADSAAGKAAHTVKDCVQVEEEVDELPYLLKVAWPVFRAAQREPAEARVLCDDDTVSFFASADLSRSVVQDFERERALIVARTIARGTAKLALTKGAERAVEDKSEVAGRIVGLLGNVGNVLLERADTRSWHLLPAGVSIARIQLPAGTHRLSVEIAGSGGAIDVGDVQVAAGGIGIVPVRSW